MTDIATRRFDTLADFNTALIGKLGQALAGNAAVMLSGGRTPLPAYRELAARNPHPGAGLHLLYSDDRYVPADSQSSNYFQTLPLLDSLRLPHDAVLRVRTELELPQATADYERRLRAMLDSGVRIGLGLLGLGADGHTASLFDSRHLQQARGHLAIAVDRPDGMQAVSVTPELLSQVAEPVFLVCGADKHAVVQEFLKDDSSLIARRAVAGCPRAEIWIAA